MSLDMLKPQKGNFTNKDLFSNIFSLTRLEISYKSATCKIAFFGGKIPRGSVTCVSFPLWNWARDPPVDIDWSLPSRRSIRCSTPAASKNRAQNLPGLGGSSHENVAGSKPCCPGSPQSWVCYERVIELWLLNVANQLRSVGCSSKYEHQLVEKNHSLRMYSVGQIWYPYTPMDITKRGTWCDSRFELEVPNFQTNLGSSSSGV